MKNVLGEFVLLLGDLQLNFNLYIGLTDFEERLANVLLSCKVAKALVVLKARLRN